MNYGIKIIPRSMRKNIKAGYETRKKRALAINKNMRRRHRHNRANRIHHQIGIYHCTVKTELEGKAMEKQEEHPTKIFAVKTTTGQEKNVAKLVAAKIEMNKIRIKAILVPETLRGYIFIEAEGPHFVEEAIGGIRHVRSRVPGVVSFSEIERYIVRKPIIEELSENDIVEVTGGPFKGMRAKITRIDKTKAEVTLELLEATFTLPITVHSDYVKIVEKTKTGSGET
jgi:transcriptional antiterminator NusG